MAFLTAICNIFAAALMTVGTVSMFIITGSIEELKGLPTMLAFCFGLPSVLMLLGFMMRKSARAPGITMMVTSVLATACVGLIALVVNSEEGAAKLRGGFKEAVETNDFNYVTGIGVIAGLFALGLVLVILAERSRRTA